MLRTLALAAAVGLIAMPAMAQTACHQPYVPDAPSSAALTTQDIKAMRDDAKSFLDASDVYQVCLSKSAIGARHSAAKVSALIEQSQHHKKLVGDRINAAIKSFNVAQPNVKLSDARR